MNILIFDKEKESFEMLREMISQHHADCTFFGPVKTIAEGQTFFLRNKTRIDVIVANVQLADGLSFYALDDAPADVPVIFLADTGEHALKAFEYNSLSYILKPVSPTTLMEAIRKTQERLITDEHRKELLQMIKKQAKYRERFLVKTFKGETLIDISQIRYWVSEEKSTYAVKADGTMFAMDRPLNVLITELDPRFYMRVNRKYIVPAREIERFEHSTNGKEILILRGEESPDIVLSREGKQKVHDWLA